MYSNTSTSTRPLPGLAVSPGGSTSIPDCGRGAGFRCVRGQSAVSEWGIARHPPVLLVCQRLFWISIFAELKRKLPDWYGVRTDIWYLILWILCRDDIQSQYQGWTDRIRIEIEILLTDEFNHGPGSAGSNPWYRSLVLVVFWILLTNLPNWRIPTVNEPYPCLLDSGTLVSAHDMHRNIKWNA